MRVLSLGFKFRVDSLGSRAFRAVSGLVLRLRGYIYIYVFERFHWFGLASSVKEL